MRPAQTSFRTLLLQLLIGLTAAVLPFPDLGPGTWTLAAAPAAPSPAQQLAAAAAPAPAAAQPGQAPGRRTPLTPNGAWTVYHRDNAHTGYDPTQGSGVNSVTPGWTSAPLDGQVYAEPLVYGGIVYTVTLNNTLWALNQTDGTGVWAVHLRNPVTTGWSCGNVSPQGILGTPVIDPGAGLNGRIYLADLEVLDQLYHVYGLNLVTGQTEMETVIPTSIGDGTFDWRIQQQRGALAVANGYVYVPFGGRWGDCGSYHGWVVAVPTDGVSALKVYETPSVGEGVWAAGGVVIDDATGNVFFATGNAMPKAACSAATLSDAVVSTTPLLALKSSFQPQDWNPHWCYIDQDLGSASPLLISPNLAFQTGKWGTGFLLDPTKLGGVDGQLFPTPTPQTYVEADVCLGNVFDATFGSYAYANSRLYLECEGHGIVSLSVDTAAPSFSLCDATCAPPSWHTATSLTFGPPIVAGGLVWAVNNGSGLWAWDAKTGARVFQSTGFGVNRFVTPSEAGGQVFVPAGNVIMSFVLHTGAPQVPPVAPVPRALAGQVAPPPVPGRPPAPQVSPVPPLPR